MKTITKISIVILLVILGISGNAQNINWAGVQKGQKHIANINTGWDYGATLGTGYAYKFKLGVPMIINGQFSIPGGKKLLDDFKSKLGVQAMVVKAGGFVTTLSAYGIYREYRSSFVKLQNFGSEFTAVMGYYKPKWYAAAEVGFDKAITTRVINSDIMLEINPTAQNGWYIPTGGNFMYGIQGGYSLKHFDVTLKVGKIIEQDFRTTPIIPYYFQLGTNVRF